MIKKIIVTLLIFIVLFLFLGCQQKVEQPTFVQEPKVIEAPADEIPTTEETLVDEVESGISDVNNVDEELDASELDDLEDVLSDIENI